MNAPILITGAPGNVGTPLVERLLAAGMPVRVAAHDLAKAARFADAGAEVVRFDMNDRTSFGVFDGVRRMFLLRPPAIADVDGVVGPVIEAARARGVEHIVFLSIQGAERNRLVPHRAIEDYLRRHGPAWTFIRASYFMQNLTTTHLADIIEHDEIFIPAGRRSQTAHVDARDVAAVAARALLEDGHEGRAYTPTGPRAMTYDACAASLTEVLGRTIRYADPTPWAYWRRMSARGMPIGMRAVTLGIYTAARFGLAAALTNDVETLTGSPATDFATFAADHRAEWGVARRGSASPRV
ncbi:MAG: NmrA family NAD(P)-binding protein [Candidatus Limnocylindrales bacterium]